MLGLGHPNSVSTYAKRYADFPVAVYQSGSGRPRLWLRRHIEDWARRRTGRGR